MYLNIRLLSPQSRKSSRATKRQKLDPKDSNYNLRDVWGSGCLGRLRQKEKTANLKAWVSVILVRVVLILTVKRFQHTIAALPETWVSR